MDYSIAKSERNEMQCSSLLIRAKFGVKLLGATLPAKAFQSLTRLPFRKLFRTVNSLNNRDIFYVAHNRSFQIWRGWTIVSGLLL